MTLIDLEGLFQAGSPWREHKPLQCPYCNERISRTGGIGMAAALLGVLALARLLLLPLGRRPLSPAQIVMTAAGGLLLTAGGMYLGQLPYRRGKGPQYPVTDGIVRLERLSKKRLFSQWRSGMVQPVFFTDETGKPVSQGVCAIFTEVRREKENLYTARMELVPYHAPCEFPGAGGRFFLFIQGEKAAHGQIVANLPECSVDS